MRLDRLGSVVAFGVCTVLAGIFLRYMTDAVLHSDQTPAPTTPALTTVPARAPTESLRAVTVGSCMREHGLRQQHQIETDSTSYSIFATRDRTPLQVYEQRVYRRCDVPPLEGADPDGYLEISVTIMEAYPSSSNLATEASGVGLATRISAPCRRVRLDYVYRGESRLSVTAESGRAVRAFGGEAYTDSLPLEVRQTEAVVLHNGKYDLKAVHCVPTS